MGGAGAQITTPPSGVVITNGGFYPIGGGAGVASRNPSATISGGIFSAPPGGWGLVVNDTDLTLSGGTFSSIALQYETNGTVNATVAPDAEIETGDGVWLGYYGSDSSLTLQSNATLSADQLFVGYAAPASSNQVVVSGAGARLNVREGLALGGHSGGTNQVSAGIGNRIEVANGGWVVVGDAVELPQWGSGILVGATNGIAEMVVANGSRVESGILGVGTESNQVGSVIVKGAGTAWNQNGQIVVGEKGSGSELLIEDGAQVTNKSSFIGVNGFADNNRVVVIGVRSGWYSEGSILVGQRGL